MAVGNNELLEKALSEYFKVLSVTGHRDYNDVYLLLVYDFIVSIIEGMWSIYVTEDDYKAMSKALNCLYGSSCLIPYPEYITEETRNMLFVLRLTEHEEFRLTEDVELRITEK